MCRPTLRCLAAAVALVACAARAASLEDGNSSSRLLASAASCAWPIDLSLERDGVYGDRTAASINNGYRGRSGNAIIQYLAVRLNAAGGGGFAVPWSGLVRMGNTGVKGGTGAEEGLVWGPRFGKLAVCGSPDNSFPCPRSSTALGLVSSSLPKSVAKQACPPNDAKFHQNYEYFRGRRDATRYLMATADDVSAEELAAWERIMAPIKVRIQKKARAPSPSTLCNNLHAATVAPALIVEPLTVIPIVLGVATEFMAGAERRGDAPALLRGHAPRAEGHWAALRPRRQGRAVSHSALMLCALIVRAAELMDPRHVCTSPHRHLLRFILPVYHLRLLGSVACTHESSMSLACWNALTHTHLCSWRRDLVDGEWTAGAHPQGVRARCRARTRPTLSHATIPRLPIWHLLFQYPYPLPLSFISDALFSDGTCDEHLGAPSYSFYQRLFKERSKRHPNDKPGSVGGWDNVWLLSDPGGHSSAVAKRLVSELGVKVPFHHSDRGFLGPLEDIHNLKAAKYVIQSYGTFSWVGAFLGNAVEVHKPYTSNNWANHWAEESFLFVDDQPEYIYHNTETGDFFESAAEVLTNHRASAFVQGVLSRPKATSMPPIVADAEACGKNGGKWVACEDAPGTGPKAASCSLRGAVIFRSPCHAPCYAHEA